MKTSVLILAAALSGFSLPAADTAGLDSLLRDGFMYRNLGPFRAGSWVPDIAVPASPLSAHLYTIYVTPRNGGVWKTTNNGTTFTPLFDQQDVQSMGAISIAPSNPDIIWVGSGDASCTRSASRGDGIYKSADAGKSWQFMGLPDSQHIARIVIDPKNPDVVYVAAMGHLFTTNEERGVFKTTDGGKTWKKMLYVNERTGVIDLVMDHNHPKTLYAATYDCIRHPWVLDDGGPGSGVYKSTDAGATWKKLGGGFPSGTIGRIGIDLYQRDPKFLYALVDNRNRATNAPDAAAGAGRRGGGGGGPRLVGGEVYRSGDAGATWSKMSSSRDDLSRKSGYAFNQLRVNPTNHEQVFITGETLSTSRDGGKTWSSLTETRAGRPFARAFGDFRTLWIDPENPDHMLAGSDGGVFISYDGGKTCDHLANLPLGEVYALTTDMDSPYNIYAGLQDHESWKGPVDGWSGSVGEEDWTTVGIGDGMYNQVDPTDSRWVYNTQEFSRVGRFDQKTRTRTIVAPTQAEGQAFLRFNWVAPIRLSPHDPKTLYAGAQVLFRSKDRGDHWEAISPDLTSNDTNKISRPGGSIQFCTITTIGESPAQAGVIWVGTDDGKVQVTKDAGGSWTDVTPQIVKAGGLADVWVSRVCPSPTVPGTAYVSKTGHRNDDFRPYLYKTTDFGATWTVITNQLPERPVNVVFEDLKNPNLVFAGTDSGVYASVDGGGHWSSLRGNMPPALVSDMTIQPREGQLVVGTYGRGIWVADITPLREINGAMLDEPAHLFAVQPRTPRQQGAQGNYRLYGDRHMITQNEANATVIDYYLKAAATDVSLTVADANGATVSTLAATTNAGMNRVAWTRGGGGGGFGGGGGRRGGGGARPLPAGEYTVTLKVNGQTYTQKTTLTPEQTAQPGGDSGDTEADDVQ